MVGCAGESEVRPPGQNLDRSLTLGEQVEQFESSRARQRFTDACELLVYRRLQLSITQLTILQIFVE